MKSKERIVQDVYLLLSYFGAETKTTHNDMISKVNYLGEYWPNGREHFDGVISAVTSVFLNKDDPSDLSSQAGHLEEYFTGKAHRDGVWEGKLKRLVEADPEALEAINTLSAAIATAWENDHR